MSMQRSGNVCGVFLSSSNKFFFIFKDKRHGNLHSATNAKGVKFERLIMKSDSI